ncbi:MAG: hypothetical protein ACREQF_07930 [Candidatus Binataceae bacterium]
MARYSVEMNRAASSTLSVGSVTSDATTPRRLKLSDMIIGSEATPADLGFLWQIQRCTTAGTNTAVTPQALDPADAAALFDAGEAHSADPTLTANAILLSIALNQRATFRWVAAPGGELVVPATASNGLALRTPTAGGTPAITATLHVEEL